MPVRLKKARAGTFFTENVEHAEFVLGNSAVPYHSELLSGREEFSTAISVRQGFSASVSHVKSRGRCRIHTAMPGDAFGVVISAQGLLPHASGGTQVIVGGDSSFVQSAGDQVEVVTPSEYELYFLRMHHAPLKLELEKLLNHEVTRPLRFDPLLRLNSSAGGEIAAHVRQLYQTIDDAQAGGTDRQSRIHTLESRLSNLLLSSQGHNYLRVLNRRYDVPPARIRRAVEFIEANLETGITLGDMALAAGTNSRTLQYGFQKHLGCSPLQYLKRVRLMRAHQELRDGHEEETVTNVASRLGFLHFGRFALEYRKAFGERPSETLLHAR